MTWELLSDVFQVIFLFTYGMDQIEKQHNGWGGFCVGFAVFMCALHALRAYFSAVTR